MTRDEALAMVWEWSAADDGSHSSYERLGDLLQAVDERAESRGHEAERDACARECIDISRESCDRHPEGEHSDACDWSNASEECASRIRARGQEECIGCKAQTSAPVHTCAGGTR